ncbi:MAG: hypothetical protein H6Q89_1264 [Myxococcaceae bacterium]|nr:hypothetical protein [Myxococcaceae bacterium]
MDDIREIKEIWRGEIGRALKGGRVIVLLILFLLFTALALTIVGSINHQLNSQVDQAVAAGQVDAAAAAAQAVEGRKKFLSTFFTDDDALLDWLSAMPLVLFVVFKLTMVFAPLFIALMSFDQISGEIGPKSIRYLVVRVKRSSILIGKFLAQATLASGLLVLCTVMMVAVAKVLNADFTAGSAVVVGLKLCVVLVVFALAYLGLSSLCSAVTRQSGVSLVLNVMHPEPARFLSAGMVHLGFALFFLGLAHLALRRRDL